MNNCQLHEGIRGLAHWFINTLTYLQCGAKRSAAPLWLARKRLRLSSKPFPAFLGYQSGAVGASLHDGLGTRKPICESVYFGYRLRLVAGLPAAAFLLLIAFIGTSLGADIDGLLFNTVFERLADSAFLPPDGLSAELVARIRSFQVRAKAFKSQIPAPAVAAGPEKELNAKRRRMEGGIVALISAPGIEALAADYVGKARIFYEWEGMSEGPLEEAAYAESFLKSVPNTILKPYLELFLAHRYKCSAEALEREKKPARERALQDFRRHLEMCLKDSDPLIRFIAESMRNRPFLYLQPDIAPPKSGVQSRPSRPSPDSPGPESKGKKAPGPPERDIGTECPDSSMPDPIMNPRNWALRCFEAEFGKEAALPESLTQFDLDFDRDGLAELFIGSTVARGNAGGLHYVFRRQGTHYLYMGSLSLHPDAFKMLEPGEGGKPLMARYVRLGAGEGLFETIAYDGGRFVVQQSERVDVQGKDAARMSELFGSAFKPAADLGSAEPALSIQKALALAEAYAAKAQVDLSSQHIHSMVLRYEEKNDPKGLYWHVQWMWNAARIGGEYGLRVFMDGRIVDARLGP